MISGIDSFRPRAQRSLKRLSAFKGLDKHEVMISFPELSEKILDEGLIGVYQNDCDSYESSILFTDRAIYFFSSEEWTRIGYHEIVELQPDIDKTSASCIGIVLASQEVKAINITGVEGKYRDYHTVYQFLHRIIGDLSS
jgi:hypothetical protein